MPQKKWIVALAALVAASFIVSSAKGQSITVPVQVVNTPTVTNQVDGQNNPVPLATLEAIQPYEDGCSVNFNGQPLASCNFQTIPAGKRLIVQEFDAWASLEPGVKPLEVVANVSGFQVHGFVATYMGSDGVNDDYYATHQETRLYGSNYTPQCGVVLNASSNLFYNCQLSGFLVDVH